MRTHVCQSSMKCSVSMMKYGLAVQYIFAFIFRLIGAQLKGVNKSNTTLETYSMYIVWYVE